MTHKHILLAVVAMPLSAWAGRASLLAEVGDGAAAYQDANGGVSYTSSNNIKLVELSTGETTKVGHGRCPEFSPDSSKLVWLDGNVVKGIERKHPSVVHSVISGVRTDAGVHWYDNDQIMVVKGGEWRRVDLLGQNAVTLSNLTALGTGGTECDVRRRGNVWVYVTGSTWKSSDGRSGSTGGTCACSISADGKRVTGLLPGHERCKMTPIASTTYANIHLDYVRTFDNHRFSSNDERYVVARDEELNKLVVINAFTEEFAVLGTVGANRGDFTVGDADGTPWPGVEGAPELSVSPGSLIFLALENGDDPPAQAVEVTNLGDQTLDPVTATTDAPWLTVSVSGSGNTQEITNSISLEGLSPASHVASVTVEAANAPNSPLTYDVNLTVEAAPVSPEPWIEISSPVAGDRWLVGGTQTIKWSAQNLNDVRVRYSCDGGISWGEIASTVELGGMDWGNLPWTVPNEPSEECVVEISGYFGEAPTESDPFAIVDGEPPPYSPGDPLTDEPPTDEPLTNEPLADDSRPDAPEPDNLLVGGCATTPAGGAWLVLLVLLTRTGGRALPSRRRSCRR